MASFFLEVQNENDEAECWNAVQGLDGPLVFLSAEACGPYL